MPNGINAVACCPATRPLSVETGLPPRNLPSYLQKSFDILMALRAHPLRMDASIVLVCDTVGSSSPTQHGSLAPSSQFADHLKIKLLGGPSMAPNPKMYRFLDNLDHDDPQYVEPGGRENILDVLRSTETSQQSTGTALVGPAGTG